MDYICPLCNALETKNVQCKACHHQLQDVGKVVDFLDDYSAYEEVMTLKLVDGLQHSVQNQQCLHLFHCTSCQAEEQIPIQEKQYFM